MTYDTIIRNGRWFDGTGAPSAIRNIGIRDGRVVAVTPHPLDETGADVVDATGKWVLPGMVDSTPTTTSRCSVARACPSRSATA